MKKKLVLINAFDRKPQDLGRFFIQNPFIKAWKPVQLGIIAALTPNDWDIELVDENYEKFEFIHADLVAISSYTHCINSAYEIAGIYKKHNIPVVLGGIHASFFPEEAAQFVDIVAIGRAEGVWHDIINDFNNKNLKKIYTCKEDTPVCFKPDNAIFKKYDYPFGTVMASLGCPYNCEFCNIPRFLNHKYYLRDVDDIIEELKETEEEFFIFNDDNIIGNTESHKNRLAELFTKMIENRINKKFQCACTINIAQYPDLLKLAHKAGCVLLYIGIESDNTKELSLFNKPSNKAFAIDKYKKAYKTINRHKIFVFGGIICGTDEDKEEDILRKKDILVNSALTAISLTYLTPLPKTLLYERLDKEGRLLYKSYPQDWVYYNCYCVTFSPKHGTQAGHFEAYLKATYDMYHNKRTFWPDLFTRKFLKAWYRSRSLKATIEAHLMLNIIQISVYTSPFFRFLLKYFYKKT